MAALPPGWVFGFFCIMMVLELLEEKMPRPKCLYYIAHIDNLSSILKDGVLSRHAVNAKANNNNTHTDIHDKSVLARRGGKSAGGRSLWEYVNLYFHARNAMLYRVLHGGNGAIDNTVVLQIDSAVLDLPGVYVSDKNAAADDAGFFEADDAGLAKIDWRVFGKEFWNAEDGSKQQMMAEGLVPDRVLPESIIGVYVGKSAVCDAVKKVNENLECSVVPDMFFLPKFQRRLNDHISLALGDMFFSGLQTFTISVNTQGVMGKGLASRAKYQFPDAYVRYQDDCKSKRLKLGRPTLYKRSVHIEDELSDEINVATYANGHRWFLFLPTKGSWREDSDIAQIEKSMQWLVENYKREGIESIAMPALGCGLGNLKWRDVGPMMCRYLMRMDIQSCVYLPAGENTNSEFTTAEYLLKK